MKNVMKLICTMLLTMTVQSVLLAQDFFPEGTKWTEIRLDTLMYDSWYSKSGNEWVPNLSDEVECRQRAVLSGRDRIQCDKLYPSSYVWYDREDRKRSLRRYEAIAIC